MPGTVIAAIVVVSLVALLSLVSFIRSPGGWSLFGIAIYTLILIGFVRGHALAWQWGIVIPSLFGVLGLIGVVTLGRVSLVELAILMPLLLYLSIPILLSFKTSRIFFGLQCPQCGQIKVRARSFFFTKRRCAACRFEWTSVRQAT
jgi:hypothetical protein